MLPADDSPDRSALDAVDHLRHDPKTPLTPIYTRAYLLRRAIRRAPAFSDEERTQLLQGVAGIEGAVREMVTVIDGIGEKHRGS